MRVLIAYDGSAGADLSLTFAQSIQWPADSTLRIAAVVEPAFISVAPMAAGLAFPSSEIDAQIAAYQQDQVAKAAGDLRSHDFGVEGVVLRGRAATVLVDEATQFAADLVMGGSRGRGTISSLLLGSVSAEVVDQAPCPVLVARTASMRKVIFATDGSTYSEAAEAILSRWSIFEDLPIRVVSIADVPAPWLTDIGPAEYRRVMEAHDREVDQAKAEHTRIAEETVARLRASGRMAESDVRTGDAAAGIISATGDTGADLVVIGSRGKTGLARIILGSVARNVLFGSSSSVLVVHEPKESNRRGS